MGLYALLYLKRLTNRTYFMAQELCSMLCGSLDGRGLWGRTVTCVCLAESLRCSLETVINAVSRLYPPQYKIKSF